MSTAAAKAIDKLTGDVRQDRSASNPATWARINHNYAGIQEVLA